MIQRRVVLLVLLWAGIAGCLWVKPSSGGERVREATAAEVVGCAELGTASGTTRTSEIGRASCRERVYVLV